MSAALLLAVWPIVSTPSPGVEGSSFDLRLDAGAFACLAETAAPVVSNRRPLVPLPPELVLRNRIRFWASSAVLAALATACIAYRVRLELRLRSQAAGEPDSESEARPSRRAA